MLFYRITLLIRAKKTSNYKYSIDKRVGLLIDGTNNATYAKIQSEILRYGIFYQCTHFSIL